MAEKKEKQASSLPRPLRLFYGIGEFGQQLSVLTLNLYLPPSWAFPARRPAP